MAAAQTRRGTQTRALVPAPNVRSLRAVAPTMPMAAYPSPAYGPPPAVIIQAPPEKRKPGKLATTAKAAVNKTKEVVAAIPANVKANAANDGIAGTVALVAGIVAALAVRAGARPRTVVIVTAAVGGAIAIASEPGSKVRAAALGAALGGIGLAGAAAVGAWDQKKRAKEGQQQLAQGAPAPAQPGTQPAPGQPARNAPAMPEGVAEAIEEARMRSNGVAYSEYAGYPPYEGA